MDQLDQCKLHAYDGKLDNAIVDIIAKLKINDLTPSNRKKKANELLEVIFPKQGNSIRNP